MSITTSSGPGIALKGEAMGLGMILELPMLIINIQRGGPSTGLPTKTEQSDLLQVMYGRNGESPLPVIAARSPADCFETAIEAWRVAAKFMCPVMVLSMATLPMVQNLGESLTSMLSKKSKSFLGEEVKRIHRSCLTNAMNSYHVHGPYLEPRDWNTVLVVWKRTTKLGMSVTTRKTTNSCVRFVRKRSTELPISSLN